MNPSISDERIRWTTADLELLPESSNRYEIINGELLVTRAPHWKHQKTANRAASALDIWSLSTGLGETVQAPGVIFSDADNVIPDVVWVSQERLANGLDEAGHLTLAPELVVEVLSPGVENQRRDRETKLKLYAERGVQEYWILDWRSQQVEVYRRQRGLLKLVVTLFVGDDIVSPLLPDFSCPVARLFV
ncbi:Uma2 family endonuclease [Leptolyngbya sp. AN03gr2]|uniref:Uma2 family endonuclease n=1 Tax=unclassified Leptolyngbya TaxID=2650499 RepID=UPI003D31FFD3